MALARACRIIIPQLTAMLPGAASLGRKEESVTAIYIRAASPLALFPSFSWQLGGLSSDRIAVQIMPRSHGSGSTPPGVPHPCSH